MTDISLQCGDSERLLSQLCLSDLIVADPPYNMNKKYNTYDDLQPQSQYIRHANRISRGAYRSLRSGGGFFLVVAPMIARLWRDAAEDAGFQLVQKLIWAYTFGQNNNKRYTPSHAEMLWFWKPTVCKPPTFNRDDVLVPSWRAQHGDKRCANTAGKTPGTVWTDIPRLVGNAKERCKWHPCQLPYRLVERIVKAHSNEGDLVIDPYHGTGTTGVVCEQLGRDYIGIDVDRDYLEASRARFVHPLNVI